MKKFINREQCYKYFERNLDFCHTKNLNKLGGPAALKCKDMDGRFQAKIL